MKKFIWNILRKIGLAGSVQLFLKSGLKEDGWFLSFHKKECIDKNGNPLPWYSYTFIKFLQERLKNTMKVFEYGAGNSTLWYAKKVSSVRSVENNKDWYEKIKNNAPKNVVILYRSLENREDYTKEVQKEGILYDLIIVDGRRRNDCVENSIPFLNKEGVIILDNSEREDYAPAKKMLQNAGFKCLDFWGMPVGTAHNSCTSLYYRPNNIFNI